MNGRKVQNPMGSPRYGHSSFPLPPPLLFFSLFQKKKRDTDLTLERGKQMVWTTIRFDNTFPLPFPPSLSSSPLSINQF